MKRIFTLVTLIFLTGFMVGCEKTGYMVTINTNHIKYDNLQEIEKILIEKGFETAVWERKKDKQ